MVIIDTHVLLWLLSDSAELSASAKKELKSGKEICVSIASLWEIAIKKSIGKLKLSYSISDIAEKCEKYKIGILPIRPEHLDLIQNLQPIHSDPFDRLIIAQAITEHMAIITRDSIIPRYDGVDIIW